MRFLKRFFLWYLAALGDGWELDFLLPLYRADLSKHFSVVLMVEGTVGSRFDSSGLLQSRLLKTFFSCWCKVRYCRCQDRLSRPVTEHTYLNIFQLCCLYKVGYCRFQVRLSRAGQWGTHRELFAEQQWWRYTKDPSYTNAFSVPSSHQYTKIAALNCPWIRYYTLLRKNLCKF